MDKLIKTPSALVPLLMSVSAFILILYHLVLVGITKTQDEGSAARIFQLLLVGQVPFIAYFAISHSVKHPRTVLQVIIIQVVAALIPIFTIFILEKLV